VAFNLTADGRQNLQTTGKGKLRDAVIDIYGANTAAKMLALENDTTNWQPPAADGISGQIRVTGMAGAPELAGAAVTL